MSTPTTERASHFAKGRRVVYVPWHVRAAHARDFPEDLPVQVPEGHWILTDPGCERGVVSSVAADGSRIFVKYDTASRMMLTGDEPYTAAATDPGDLCLL